MGSHRKSRTHPNWKEIRGWALLYSILATVVLVGTWLVSDVLTGDTPRTHPTITKTVSARPSLGSPSGTHSPASSPTGEAAGIADGLSVAGRDFEAGAWRVAGQEGCSWQLVWEGEALASGGPTPEVIEVRTGQQLQSKGCSWERVGE